MAIDIQREADDLVRYYGELGRRLAETGVRDIPELLALHDRLRRALDALTPQEIGWALEQAQRLIQELVRMEGTLQSVRRLKAAFELPTSDPERHG